jgi:intraflagellar transport protein 56
MPTLQDYIKKRDWIGAVALLESERNVNIQVENSLWLAYCYFHMGEYR